MSFNKNCEEIDNLLNKARKRYVIEITEKFMDELHRNNSVLKEEQQEFETLQQLSAEENNKFIQHLLKEGKKRCEVKLAKPIEINKEI